MMKAKPNSTARQVELDQKRLLVAKIFTMPTPVIQAGMRKLYKMKLKTKQEAAHDETAKP